MKKQPIILVGGGGHCISCIDVVEQTGLYDIIGIIDQPDKKGDKVLSYEVIGNDDDIPMFIKSCPNFLITVGQIKSAALRNKLYNIIKKAGGHLPVIVSPMAYVSQHACIAEGSIVMHHAIVNAGAQLGSCCIINTKSLIEHEVEIGDFSHVSTGACINGQVSIGEHCFVGSNAVIVNNISIGDFVVISAGALVLKNLMNQGVYIGNPIKKIG